MDSFLENVKIYANEFLETSNLPYRVSKFDISDSEFRIEALKNGRVVDDVKKMSKGESALMSLAISFGKQRVMSSLDKYKIISLDEVDSYLKEEKKEIFKDIVLKQKEIFNLDQVFIVTHNENFTKMNNVSHICFDKSNVDPYSNKRIIYHHKLN
jgi:DNA repair exonuclease SbcCD ATPase subunit